MGSSPTPGTNPFRITEKLTMSKNIADREPKNKTKKPAAKIPPTSALAKKPAKKEVETSKFMWANLGIDGTIEEVHNSRATARAYGSARKVLVTLV